MTALLLVLTPALPALMAALALFPATQDVVRRTAFLAAIPGLLAAWLLPSDAPIVLSDVLLGLRLGLDEPARPFLLAAALLWLLAGLHARVFLPVNPRTPRFMSLFLLSMSGNLGLLLAQDVVGFYLAFAQMSLAAYVLVVHDETAKAQRAGSVYIRLAVIGETCLLLGFMLAASKAQAYEVTALRAALLDGETAPLAVTLLLVGFGIKLGLVPLHVWLPLAHPAAPSPASAVLSGAMIKAGLFGLMVFLPFGDGALTGLGVVLVAIGLFTAFFGVAAGLAQADAKTVLAYSSLSQMGVITSGLGVAALDPAAAPAILKAAGLYALHHGLVKGGLFLAVGARQRAADQGAWRPVVTVAVALGALTLAGLPLTSGALAKYGLKAAVESGTGSGIAALTLALALSATATTLLVLHFLQTFQNVATKAESRSPGTSILLLTSFAALAAGQGLMWALAPEPWRAAASSWAGTVDAAWPLLLGAVLAALAVASKLQERWPDIPEGDVLVPARRAFQRVVAAAGDPWRRRQRWLGPRLRLELPEPAPRLSLGDPQRQGALAVVSILALLVALLFA
ncbi:MAG: NADH/ubiquinone/plastoquinone (complex I) [Geminicoccaceae bacterium]|nr:MAG: NADH/ubiquinone/plastoquinone (complex I) [Geminicoccaceae bacterium]